MEQQRHTSENAINDGISVKELILKIGDWKRYLLSKWVVIVTCGLIGAGLGLLKAFISKPDYVAELTFVLEDSKSGSLGSYASIASQFGVDLGGGGSVGVFSGDNIVFFLTSRLMVEKTLLSEVVVDGKKESLAESYIDAYNLRKSWADESLTGIRLPANTDRKKFTILQDSILNVLYHQVIKKNLVVEKPDKKLSYVLVRCVSRNELFSKLFTERLVNEATAFYIDTKTKRSKINVDILQAKADSIENLLNRKTYSAAAEQDVNLNPLRQVATVGLQVASRDKLMLQTVYGEVVKNLELSKMSMAQETPVMQIIDTPIMPLKKDHLGKVAGLVIGAIIGGFLAFVALTVRKLYKDIMAG